MATQLYRESPDPLYTQLKELLMHEIASGNFLPDQRLPSERELAMRFTVSRMTVRQALLDLAREGVVYTRTGKGTYVSQPKINQRLQALSGFSQDVASRGGKPSSRVLEFKVIQPAPDVASALRLAPGQQIIMLSRLRLADGVPLALETSFLPFDRFPSLFNHDFSFESLYSVLENEYGCVLTQAEQTIEAALANKHEMDLLILPSPAAIFKMERLTKTSDGLPVEFVTSAYRGDRYKFHSNLQPDLSLVKI